MLDIFILRQCGERNMSLKLLYVALVKEKGQLMILILNCDDKRCMMGMIKDGVSYSCKYANS